MYIWHTFRQKTQGAGRTVQITLLCHLNSTASTILLCPGTCHNFPAAEVHESAM